MRGAGQVQGSSRVRRAAPHPCPCVPPHQASVFSQLVGADKAVNLQHADSSLTVLGTVLLCRSQGEGDSRDEACGT